jgi:site-specific DNA recombinase
MRCAIYTRVSVARESDPAVSSCSLQHEACEALVAARRLDRWLLLEERFDNEDESGATTDRPALQRLLERVAAHAVDCVLVYRLDVVAEQIKECGVMLHVVANNLTWDRDAITNFQFNVLAMFAEAERELIVERVRDAHAARRERGERSAGEVPLGYQPDPRTKQLVPEPRGAHLVRWMFEQAASGAAPSAIATSANKKRVKTVRGGFWTPRSVIRVLRNPVYAGMRTAEIAGVHPPLITREEFQHVGTALDQRRTRAPTPRTPLSEGEDPFLLRGLLLCGRCGRPMTTACKAVIHPVEPLPSRRDPKQARFYRCREPLCGGAPVDAAWAEMQAEWHLSNVTEHLDDAVGEHLRVAQDIWEDVWRANRRHLLTELFHSFVWDARRRRVFAVWARGAPMR